MSYTNSGTCCEENTMTLIGKGLVTAEPDTAILRLGVETIGSDLTTAQEENAGLSEAILQSLRQLGIEDIQTFQYTINRLIEYENSNRVDKGYSVRNILEIRTDETDQIGLIIDTAVRNGANVVDLVSFEVSDTYTYYLQALNLAVVNAWDKAKSIAETLGLTYIPVPRRIIENETMPVPFQAIALREGLRTTPIEAGTQRIEAAVTVTFAY
jgi:hypothetical protein